MNIDIKKNQMENQNIIETSKMYVSNEHILEEKVQN